MYRRLLCLAFLLTLSGIMGSTAFADCNWEGASSDWFNASNWVPDYPEESPGLPILIRQAGSFDPVVHGTTTGGQRVDISNNGHLTINSGGNVQSNNWYFQGRDTSGTAGDSLLTINEGGKLTAGVDNADAEARVGYHQPGMHVIQMNGGEFSVPSTLTLSVDPGSKGHIQLDGGMMSVGGLVIGAEGTIDFNGGTLVIDDNVTTEIASYVSEGKITANNGSVADVRVEYDIPYQGKTTVSAPWTVRTTAFNPDPSDGQIYENTWANLSWAPGDLAVSYDLYIGTDFDDVNNGAEGTFALNIVATLQIIGFAGSPVPEGLQGGTTYYWRVDGVNDNEPNNPWTGPVWSFKIPPKTAYEPIPADSAASINQDVDLTWTAGFGSKLHTVYFGETFDEVDNATGGSAQGSTSYTPGTLKMAKTYYWRVDEFDIIETYKGNVWSFTTEGGVSSTSPAKGAIDVIQTPVLTWIPGLGATHEIYFGSDAGALEKKASGNLGSESYEPGQLEWNTTYYWRVDEANNANADSPWTGPLWSFTTANFLIIDDFEAYNALDPADPESNRIFNVWLDGFDNPAVNGSVVGNANAPFAEQTIVHEGLQSMPMAYDNAVGKSEATLTLTSNRDWTVNGVTTLTIWYRGSNNNAAETMYVTLNGSVTVDNDNPDAALSTRWTEWNISLQAFADQGVNLTNVTSITLGLRSVTGGSGMMYFDDIRLYALESEAP
ncbi:MAG: hypothetical protein H8D56_25615 [Planctomycetes bacterium]|nr:hypothetical protein [Planctomycetota bacterium]